MTEIASFERELKTYPSPPKITAYSSTNFHDLVLETCLNERNHIRGLKIAKMILLGDISVGKTSIVNRFCYQTFDHSYKATIGVDFEVQQYRLLGIPCSLQIWDTAGQERFKCIASAYYRGSNAIVVVFDVTNKESLMHCIDWFNDALLANNGKKPFLFLVGSKYDLVNRQQLEHIHNLAVAIATKLNAELWYVSSKSGQNIHKVFDRIAALTFNDSIFRELNAGVKLSIAENLISLYPEQKPRKPSCSCSK